MSITWGDGFSVCLPTSYLMKTGLSRVTVSKGASSNYALPRISFYFNNYAQRFSKAEFEFLIQQLRVPGVNSISIDRSLTKRLIFHRLNDRAITFFNVDEGKGFGILLQYAEIDDLLKVEKIFNFLLEKQNANEESLKEIIFGTYVHEIYKKVIQAIEKDCEDCLNNIPMSNTHYCQRLTSSFELIESFIDSASKDNKIKEEFDLKFNFICDNLFVSDAHKIILRQYVLQFPSMRREMAQQVLLAKDYATGKVKMVEEFWKTLADLPKQFTV